LIDAGTLTMVKAAIARSYRITTDAGKGHTSFSNLL
jgi:hypothetical protein